MSPVGMSREYRDLGSGFYYTFVQDGDTQHAGVIIWRIEPREPGMVAYNPDEDPDPEHIYMAHAICIFAREGYAGTPTWELHSLDPLHIEPSIQMYDRKTARTPTFHGHIRGGRWGDA